MRIKTIEAANFKSLVDFRLELAKFNCLIGLNGAGKSTVLQFIDFVSQLVVGDMKDWLQKRKWKPNDLRSKLSKKLNVRLHVRFENEDGNYIGKWEALYNPTKYRCTHERIKISGFSLIQKENEIIVFDNEGRSGKSYEIAFDYEGSILSALKEELLPKPILECKRLFEGIQSLDMLAPENLRQRTRESFGNLGLGGQNLASFIHEMDEGQLDQLNKALRFAYPHLRFLRVKPLRSGWKQIEAYELFDTPESKKPRQLITEARHVNDGMLRLAAILAELYSNHGFLLFDEIENGINPELVEFLIDQMVSSRQQILVTTHSPMILNYLSDEMAKAGVMYLYKTSTGETKSIPFFTIPSLAEKLTVMGPGEAFVDTNLTALGKEIEALTEES